MERSKNVEQPTSDNHGQEGWEQKQKREEELFRATKKVGKAIVDALNGAKAQLSRGELLSFNDAQRFYFFRAPERVSVEVTDYKPESRTEDELLRSFRIRLGSSGWGPEWEWLVNELADGDKVKFEPFILEHQDTAQFLREQQGEQYEERSDLGHFGDPSVDEMEKATEIIEDCSRRFASGERSAIRYGI